MVVTLLLSKFARMLQTFHPTNTYFSVWNAPAVALNLSVHMKAKCRYKKNLIFLTIGFSLKLRHWLASKPQPKP